MDGCLHGVARCSPSLISNLALLALERPSIYQAHEPRPKEPRQTRSGMLFFERALKGSHGAGGTVARAPVTWSQTA